MRTPTLALLFSFSAFLVNAFALAGPASATVKLELGYQLNCSATIISPEGYALTALHCLPEFKIEGVSEKSIRLGSGVFTLQMARAPKNAHAVFGENLKAKIIVLGRGVPLMMPSLKTISPTDLATFKESMDDYALIKFPAASKPYSCVTTAASRPSDGSVVRHIGYPTQGPQAFSRVAVSSVGEYRQTAPPLVYKGVNATESWSKMLLHGRYGFTTASTFNGFSGGGVVNSKDELIGVTSLGLSRDFGRVAFPVTAIVAAQHIRADVTALLGKPAADRIFKCRP